MMMAIKHHYTLLTFYYVSPTYLKYSHLLDFENNEVEKMMIEVTINGYNNLDEKNKFPEKSLAVPWKASTRRIKVISGKKKLNRNKMLFILQENLKKGKI